MVRNATKVPKPVVKKEGSDGALSIHAYEDLLADLREIDIKLYAIRTPDMQGKELGEWFAVSGDVAAAIEFLERESLVSINAQLGKDSARIAKAIDDCENALHGLSKRADVIKIVGGIAGVISTIASFA